LKEELQLLLLVQVRQHLHSVFKTLPKLEITLFVPQIFMGELGIYSTTP